MVVVMVPVIITTSFQHSATVMVDQSINVEERVCWLLYQTSRQLNPQENFVKDFPFERLLT